MGAIKDITISGVVILFAIIFMVYMHITLGDLVHDIKIFIYGSKVSFILAHMFIYGSKVSFILLFKVI